MCEGSIHVAHRKAKEDEDLVVKEIPGHGIVGYYPADPTAKDQKLVCVIAASAVIERIEFRPQMERHLNAKQKALAGKTNVKVELRHQSYQDLVIINGDAIQLAFFANGTRFRIPPTKVGVDAVKAALAEQDKVGIVERVVTAVRRPRATNKA